MTNKLQEKDELKIIQITDTHLFSSNQELMLGHNNNKNFSNVINKIKNNHLADADLIFLTGDLSQDNSMRSYEHITSELNNTKVPVYWIPGNHDSMTNMLKVFSKQPFFKNTRCLELKHWTFIFLDTQKEGSENGFLNKDTIAFLKQKTSKNLTRNKNIAIVMHHHPAPFGTPLIDDYLLENRDEFWTTIKNSCVKMIMCGHVHGDYGLVINKVRVESAPATCFQFKKGASTIEIDSHIGYKIHRLCYNIVHSQSEIWMEPENVDQIL